MTMSALRRWYPALGLTVVLSVYWVPVLVALSWGIYEGGDPLQLYLALRWHLPQDLGALPLATAPLAPFVLLVAIVSALSLRRGSSARSTHIATLALAAPYLLLALWYVVIVALFLVSCGLHSCNFLL